MERWLQSEHSREVGWVGGGTKSDAADPRESVGHESGRRIVQIKRKPAVDLDEDDYTHMRRRPAMCTGTWRNAPAGT